MNLSLNENSKSQHSVGTVLSRILNWVANLWEPTYFSREPTDLRDYEIKFCGILSEKLLLKDYEINGVSILTPFISTEPLYDSVGV